ncbi:MAG: fimbrillin family protein [Bacteroidaceae bacterium]|nr:fimbrillin family protein [Bacteroidaceae bacterium]
MKTLKYFTILAVLGLTACTQNEIGAPELNEVGFNAVVRKNTKAIISGTTFNNDLKFKVWGFYTKKGDFSDVATDAAPNFMKGVEISYLADEAKWRNATNHYYWPNQGKVGFYAFYPETLTPDFKWGTGATIADYTLSSNNQLVDMMYAYNVGPDQAALPMVFNHALSQIEFRYQTNATYDDATVIINSITFKNVDLTADFNFNASTQSVTAEWSDNETQTSDYSYYAQSSAAAIETVQGSQAATYGEPLLFIPQTASTAELVFTVSMLNTDDIEYTTTINLNPETSAAANTTVGSWELGKKYIYTLNFKLDEINFAPSVMDWVEVQVSTIDITE